MVIDEFLAELDPDLACKSEGMKVLAMAFADDLILTAQSPNVFQTKIDRLSSFLVARVLEANAAKFSSMVIEPSEWQKRSTVCTDIQFDIHGRPLALTVCTSTWRYLEVHFSVERLEKGLVRKQLTTLIERCPRHRFSLNSA
ncbi:hypothetical protein MTO96_041780 [Rhipicephalus appendiculatus]